MASRLARRSGVEALAMTAPLPASLELTDFERASRSVLGYLRQRLGFGMWMTTRVVEPSWIVLHVENDLYDIAPGTQLRWTDTLCSRMVRGEGARIAPDVNAEPAYRSAPIAERLPIGAYAGAPIRTAGGVLFGTLCAIDPAPQSAAVEAELGQLELLAGLLGTIATKDLEEAALSRQMESLRQELDTDALTGLLNRKGWQAQVKREIARARRYGSPLCVALVDLDDLKAVNDTGGHAAGDALLTTAANCLRRGVRDSDVVARLGGDEFAVLAVECAGPGCGTFVDHLRDTLAAGGVRASIGLARHRPGTDLDDTLREADRAMYRDKRARKGADGPSESA